VTSVTKLEQTSYDRRAVSPGIVHVGYGAFHRAHQAVYVDDYMQTTGDLNWGISAVNLRASESVPFAAAQKAAEGYLLKTTAPDGTQRMRLVRPHVDFQDWSQDASAAEEAAACPTIHVISLTVTESGYYLNGDQNLNQKDPVIATELSSGRPNSVYAYLSRVLAKRAEATGLPVTIMCCDNIRANGHMVERNLLAYLELTQQGALADWVHANVCFPCSMVDRITPQGTAELNSEIAANFPNRPLAPIHGEAFTQWVLERKFAGPFPDLSVSGVQIVEDVDPFEEGKIRILNGGHTGLAYLGALAGYKTFDEAMRDPDLRAHFDGWERHEVLPGLNFDLPFDKSAYLEEVTARFDNRALADQLERICMDGWSKMPIYIRPTLGACLQQRITPRFGYDCVASWYVYARHVAKGRMPIAYHDPYWDVLEPLLQPGQAEAFARTQALWADLPHAFESFVPDLVRAIKEMDGKWPA
jgi:D-arabinitol 4-dehydrogenase